MRTGDYRARLISCWGRGSELDDGAESVDEGRQPTLMRATRVALLLRLSGCRLRVGDRAVAVVLHGDNCGRAESDGRDEALSHDVDLLLVGIVPSNAAGTLMGRLDSLSGCRGSVGGFSIGAGKWKNCPIGETQATACCLALELGERVKTDALVRQETA